MAERRMFAKTIIDSDAFLDMPTSARLLYYDLGMRADDDGFVNAPKKIMRIIGSSEDDMRLLIAKKFIIPFESGVVVIKHWKIHNFIAKDRYVETKYKNEKSTLALDENKAYTLNKSDVSTECIQPVNRMDTQVRLGKGSIGKVIDMCGASPQKNFKPPTLEEVQAYCKERNNSINAQTFIDHYTASNWYRGKTKIKDWKACIRTWEQRDKSKNGLKGDDVVGGNTADNKPTKYSNIDKSGFLAKIPV